MIKNATALVVLCENLFGWLPPGMEDGVPAYRTRAIEAGKINKAMKKNPKLVNLTNLEFAANFCFEKRIAIKSPYGLIYKIEEALKHVETPELTSDLAMLVERALAWEQGHQDSSSSLWVERLTRAHGDGRRDLLAEWEGADRG